MIGSTLKRLDALEARKRPGAEQCLELTDEELASLRQAGLDPSKAMPRVADLSLTQLRAVAGIRLRAMPELA